MGPRDNKILWVVTSVEFKRNINMGQIPNKATMIDDIQNSMSE